MDEFFLESCYHGVNFQSSRPLQRLFLEESYNCFVPRLLIKQIQLIDQPILHYRDVEMTDLDIAPQQCRISLPWRLTRNGETLMYLAYAMIERQHQINHMLTAHAASVCGPTDQSGILLLGKEGSGKSLTALKLCRDYGYRLGANDLAILCWHRSQVFVEAGTEFFFLRQESVRRNLPDLAVQIPWQETADSWLSKTKIKPEDLGIERFFKDNNRPYRIAKAYLMHVDETKTKVVVSPAPSLTTMLYLNENFSRYIRNTCTTLLGGSNYEMLGYIPSFDQPEFYDFRRRLIACLVNSLEIRHISGPLQGVAEYIATH
ncbi:MAG: hypothetical protein WC668_03845 [Patescibacteria group bacterium]|jgi:hypothetical protein